MTTEAFVNELIEGISARVGTDSRQYIEAVEPLFDEEGLKSYVRLIGSFASFDLSTAKLLLQTGGELFSLLEDPGARNEAVGMLSYMARTKWSAAAAALRQMTSLSAQPSAFIVRWLQRGNSLAAVDQDVAIQYFDSSVEVLGTLDTEHLDQWAGWGQEIAKLSWKAAKEYFRTSAEVVKRIEAGDIERWARLGIYLLEKSPKEKKGYGAHSMLAVGAAAGKAKTIDLALQYFKSAPQILGRLSIRDLQDWVEQGLEQTEAEKGKGLAYFSLQTGASRRSMEDLVKGLELKNIHTVLSSYSSVLFNRKTPLRSSSAFYKNLPGLSRFFSVTDGTRVFLPSRVSLFESEELNIKTYKWLLAHELAHLTYGTFALSSGELKALPELEVPHLSFRLFEFLEDERVDALVGAEYPGLEKDRRMLIREYLKGGRKPSLLERYSFSVLGGAEGGDCCGLHPVLLEALRRVRTESLTVHEVLEAALSVCAAREGEAVQAFFGGQEDMNRYFHRGLLDFPLVEESRAGMARMVKGYVERLKDDREAEGAATAEKVEAALLRLEEAKGLDNEELLWQVTDTERLEQLFEQLKVTLLEMEEEGRFRKAVYYDEWDHAMEDYKKDWCRVREMDMPETTTRAYQETVKEYYGLISIVKRHFGMLRPDRFKRHFREERGDDLDFDALVETMVERHAGIAPSDKVYIRRDKRLRDVSVAFLADMSFSTGDVLPSGKRIIDVEREGLVLMAEALESIGDRWAVYGFSSNYREKVDFFVVKDFGEPFGVPVQRRFEGIKPLALTRLGAAIRHANALLKRQDSLIRLLILLSDGRPYDVDYGNVEYTIEDTRMALWEGRMQGVNSFCITVDKKSREYLPRMYGEANYTVIDNIDALPITLPLIYKKLTT